MDVEWCATCREPLIVELGPDSDDEDLASVENVLDDVELSCGCHYHWECFMDAYTITQCPTCSKEISSLSPTGQQQVLCIIRNEGGEQQNYDILPSATKEAYLRTYPEERRGHALLEFCREGDIDAIVHLIKDIDEDDVEDDAEDDAIDVLRYQGTFEDIEGTGLHVAIRYKKEEVALLMLALASQLDWSRFPSHLLVAMEKLGLNKDDRKAGADIRGLPNSSGKTPFALAQEIGGEWKDWVYKDLLRP